MSEWQDTTIGSLLADCGGSVKTGPFGTALKASEYSTEGVPLISVREIGFGSLIVNHSTPRVPPEVTQRLPDYLLKVGDIVFGRKGAVDRAARVKVHQEGWFLGSDGIRLRLPEICDSRFMAYQIQSSGLRNWLIQHATGTTMASLNQNVIERMPIVVPPLIEQRAIAHILGTLDDKIELNRRMNETLESMARAIFKSWFVDFEPMRAKMSGEPPESICRRLHLTPELLDLFPDRLQDSELGEIPKGWENTSIGDFAEVRSGKRPEERHNCWSEKAQVPLWGGNGPMGFVPRPLHSQPILLTGRVGTLGSVFRIYSPCWPSDNTLVLEPKKQGGYEFLFFCLCEIDFRSLNRGSTQPLLTQTDLKAQRCVLPSSYLLESFRCLIRDKFSFIEAAVQESKILETIRDTLLPKLLSGELRAPVVGEA